MKLGQQGPAVNTLQTSLENLGFNLPKYGLDSKFGSETFEVAQKTINAIASITNLAEIVNDPDVDKFNPDGLTKVQYNILTIVGQNQQMITQIKAHLNTQAHGDNPNATNKNPSIDTSGGNEKAAYDFFVSQGYSPAGAAGIVANLKTESGYKTTAVGDNGQARSLAQWHPDRYNALVKQGFDLNNFGSALAAIDHEMQSDYPGIYQKMKAATDPAQAAALFDRGFERSSGETTQTRMRDAQTILQKYQSA